MKKIMMSLLFYLISAFGISMTIKAGIGVSSFNSLNVSLSNLTEIPIGTVTSLINLLFLVACFVIDIEKKLVKYILMLLATLSFGLVINVVYYSLFKSLVMTNYLSKLLLFIAGVCIAGFGRGQVVRLATLTFPIEFFCQLVAERTRLSFSQLRYGVDISCVVLSLSISLVFTLPIVIREGTIMSLLLLSGVINWSKNKGIL